VKFNIVLELIDNEIEIDEEIPFGIDEENDKCVPYDVKAAFSFAFCGNIDFI
jgi:hypothetical protein